MNYIHTNTNRQMEFSEELSSSLMIPSTLKGFNNTHTTVEEFISGRTIYCCNGILDDDIDRTCDSCRSGMHVNNHYETS